MRRMWCLAVLVGLSLWAAGGFTPPDAPDAAVGSSPHALSILDDPPSSDGTPDRQWTTAACPAGPTRTSQTHHAVLARALCRSMAHAPREGDVAAAPSPRVLGLQFQIPLLI